METTQRKTYAATQPHVGTAQPDSAALISTQMEQRYHPQGPEDNRFAASPATSDGIGHISDTGPSVQRQTQTQGDAPDNNA